MYINIAGSYSIKQSNATWVDVTWQQVGNQLSGFASIRGSNIKSRKLNGTVENEHVDFTIEWDTGNPTQVGHTGHYWADLFEPFNHVSYQGVLMGDAKDVCHPANWAHWEVENVTFTGLAPQHPVHA
ncbi:hypothetical protein [Streptomyces sp. CB03911]|uniref:hypothetical protein n=1 Tax=Streptomycetaceae TaxID=2062 RepID=UPI00093DA8C5|nr:hypothetical protein [Streptomyces sp. CB03911]OKI25082.1 hypothetical protein A6A07_31285 [Streptomyces sp. CB03911]